MLIKEVYNKIYDFEKTHTFPLTTLLTDGLANADGDKWVKHRKIINPAFHFEKIKVLDSILKILLQNSVNIALG